MPDYTFYLINYLGEVIPEEAFAHWIQQAEVRLNRWKERYDISALPDVADAEKMALCGMAEALYEFGKEDDRRELKGMSVGSVSETYNVVSPGLSTSSLKAREAYLLEQAGYYLRIGRWVAHE